MTIYILATTRTGQEFATADAINNLLHRPDPDGDLRSMGATAVVPRKVQNIPAKDGKPASYEYRPFMPQYIFLAMSEGAWHKTQRDPMHHTKPNGQRGILQPPRKALDILPRTWGEFQDFAARAEAACNRRIEQIERGEAVARYRKGDKLRILGDMANGQLRSEVAEFLRLDAKGRIIAQSVGIEVLGKPFTMTLDAGDVEAIAAE